MQMQTNETPFGQNVEQLTLESFYKSLDQRLGHPAGDIEICDEMKISLDAFHQILDRINGLNLGSFQKMESQNGDTDNELIIRYIPDTSKMNSSFVFQNSEIQEILTGAIEALPDMERLITALFYYSELTPKEIEAVLGISEACISHLRTKAMLRLRSRLSR
jgi:RNA polymerase sigma factor FliA